MAKKTIGYVELEWICPNCKTKNPGAQKTCISCGSPQPENVQFQKASQDKILTDAEKIEKAKAGADIHCPYCGTRNPAGAQKCSQCGGDLVGGKTRTTGQVLGTFQDKPVTIQCLNCQAENDSANGVCEKCGSPLQVEREPTPTAFPSSHKVPLTSQAKPLKFNPLLLIIPLVGFVVLCIIIFAFMNQKTETIATVMDVYWERNISIEQYGPVTKSNWIDEIPSGAQIGNCSSEYHHTSDQPEPSSTEVCEDPYVVDDGSGYGEVIQECEYLVYMDRCSYTVEEWYVVETVSSNGWDLYPEWPYIPLTGNQREGSQSERFQVRFGNGEDIIKYTLQDYDEFLRYVPGSEWSITVNGFNSITNIQPAP